MKHKKVRTLRDIENDPRVSSVDPHDEGVSVWLHYGWCNGLESGGGSEPHDNCVHSIAEDTVGKLVKAFNWWVQECDCSDRCKS